MNKSSVALLGLLVGIASLAITCLALGLAIGLVLA